MAEEEQKRLELYTRNLKKLLDDRGYDYDSDFMLGRSEIYTFTRKKPHIPITSLINPEETGYSESTIDTVIKANKLSKSKKPVGFDVLKVFLLDQSENLSVPEVRDIVKQADAEDPLGHGYVLVLWRSDEARRKLKAYKNNISPRVIVENPDILLTGLPQNSLYFTELTPISATDDLSEELISLVQNEYKNFPILKSDDLAVIYYGLVPGDIVYTHDIDYGITGKKPEFYRVIQNIS